MRPRTHQEQNQVIREQFERQAAVPSGRVPGLANVSAIDLMLEACGLTTEDTVLDVACGAGYVACACASRASHVTGIDITPAMIGRARQQASELGITNVSWLLDDILPLPFPDGAFSMVMTRYSFHHFVDPLAVLRQMARVCRPGGQVIVTDAAPAADKQAAYNRMEKLRDPSHVRALTAAELLALHAAAGLRTLRTVNYRLEMELESLLAASFPDPGNMDRLRLMFTESLANDSLDLNTHRQGDEIHFSYPSLIIVSQALR